ncbi:MAG TPA: hypothetical protein VMZ29_04290 [Candidatus Bathyarchaeia archaeon]|nr:hypothetical protein [Candidatus Bathyarchaeia archaeon]
MLFRKKINSFGTLIIAIVILTTILSVNQLKYKTGFGHTKTASPIEIFSLWNDTSPTIDGKIVFNSSSLLTEWSAAAVYSMYDKDESFAGKILLQNDDNNLYVALDLANYQDSLPSSIWGSAIYLDRDHDGLLSNFDRAITYKENITGQFVLLSYFSTTKNNWIEMEAGTVGTPLPISNILVDIDFTNSFFEQVNHHQYEFKIPFSIINSGPGKISGIGFEAFENFLGNDEEITWPYVSIHPSEIRLNGGYLGDIYFGKDIGLGNYYTKYAIETNTNIKSDAIGENFGVFLGTADIDGNGDLELIVSSNRTDTDSNYLLAIYDFNNGILTQKWTSWTTSHQSKLFAVKSIVAYDFNNNGKDEIYVAGEDNRILRFSSWNSTSNDFLSSSYVYSHTSNLMGYLAIGDANNYGTPELVFGDQTGYVNILEYVSLTDSFTEDRRSPFTVYSGGKAVSRIHAVAVGDPDDDSINEILLMGQITNNDLLSTTSLYVFYRSAAKAIDDTGDNLPATSSSLTEDRFGHTIVVADVDNDAETETIIVGKDYLKIFGKNTYANPTPPLTINLNDGVSKPATGGGATVADLDQDGNNELIFGASNGTIYIINITDSGSNSLSYQIEWSGDIGSSPGKRNSILVYDIDQDTENEIVLGDNFGQIMIIGRTNPPEISIQSPTTGSTFSSPSIYIEWEASDDLAIHHFDISVEGSFIGRTPGSQISYFVPLFVSSNLIEVIAFDVNGKNSSDSVQIGFTALAPEVHIISPDNNYMTSDTSIIVHFESYDPNDNFDHYSIWVNNIWMQNQTPEEETYLLNMPSDGLYNLTIVGVDELEKTGKSIIFITRDRSAPDIDIYSPLSNSFTKSSEIVLHWTASDSLSGIDHFTIYRDDIYYSTTTSYLQTISLELDKKYKLEVFAYDTLGNMESSIIYVNRDTIKPNIAILSPSQDIITSSTTLNLIWDAFDNIGGAGIHHSEVIVNQLTKYSGTDESTTITLEEDGMKDILITTYDKAGNSETAFISVILDQNDPYVNIIYPMTGFTTGLDFITLCWESKDNGTGIANYELFIDGQSVENITDSTITCWLLPIPIDHISIISIKASDFVGRTFEDSITVQQTSTQPSIAIVNPLDFKSYFPDNQILIEWEIANIADLTGFSIYINGTLNDTIIDINARSYLLNLSVPIDQFPLYNISIVATTTNPSNSYMNFRWIVIDQTPPMVSILTPSNNSIILVQGTYIQWSGSDTGTGIAYYKILINAEQQMTCYVGRIYYYLTFNLGDGLYSITIEAYDFAGNKANSKIMLIVYILHPEFSTNLPEIYYTQTGEFQFDFSITNTRTGVKSYKIQIDNEDVLVGYSYPILITDPFSIIVNITESNYSDLTGDHILSISVIDAYSRESIITYTIIIDNEAPEILNSYIIDNQLITTTSFEFALNNEQPDLNYHTITVTITDNEAIAAVFLIISNNDYNQIYEMTRNVEARMQTSTYTLEFDISDLELGIYNITIQAIDLAGNIKELVLTLEVIPFEQIPWILQGLNLLYVSLGFVLLVILITLFSVAIRKPLQNRNWEDDLIAVFYVRVTGLTCVYVTYSRVELQDDQLIGGAMMAIQSLLEEIIGKNAKQGLTSLEIGTKGLLLYQGAFGFGALLVNNVKPKHKEQLIEFSKRFERVYSKPLQGAFHIDFNAFQGSERLVQEYFGQIKNGERSMMEEGLAAQLKNNKEVYVKSLETKEETDKELLELLKEKTPLEELMDSISKESKNQLMKIIEITPKTIISLAENRFDEVEKLAIDITTGLEILLKIERYNKDLNYLIQNMLNLMKEIYEALEFGKENNSIEMQSAIQNASKMWFEEIAEKWSNVK